MTAPPAAAGTPTATAVAAAGPVFCTHFDSAYLPQGLALLASLERHAPGMRLWVLALDPFCHRLLAALQHPALRLLSLEVLESPDLRQARAGRSWGEYCWTLTPFCPIGCSSATPRRSW